jgi:chemotaxis protein MotB
MSIDGAVIRPIIVIKKKITHGGHHGGAWKVAYADFVTAMMSLFIVLWLLNSTPQIKKAVAGYFNDPKSGGKETGTETLGAGETVSIDQKNVEKLKDAIEKAILKQQDLDKLAKQIEITITPEGLRIELIEGKGGTFFESGSAKLSPNGVKLLGMLAGQVSNLPNHLLIEGHTDAQPFSGDNGYTNWELSSDRANSARRLLQDGGVGATQIQQVRGYADQHLRVPSDPLDPSNRRISLIVEWLDKPAAAVAGDERAPGEGKNAADVKLVTEAAKATGETKAEPNASASAKESTSTAPQPPAQPGQTLASATPPPLAPKPASQPSAMDRLTALLPGKKK